MPVREKPEKLSVIARADSAISGQAVYAARKKRFIHIALWITLLMKITAISPAKSILIGGA